MNKILELVHIVNVFITDAFLKLGLLALLSTTLIVIPCPVYPQDGALRIPGNSHLKAYSRDKWECDPGFRKNSNTCVAVRVPSIVTSL